MNASEFSPRTWGWTALNMLKTGDMLIFPTHVGMDRRKKSKAVSYDHFPHARGDGPNIGGLNCPYERFSPRTWGWTALKYALAERLAIFPTHVGMDRGG